MNGQNIHTSHRIKSFSKNHSNQIEKVKEEILYVLQIKTAASTSRAIKRMNGVKSDKTVTS